MAQRVDVQYIHFYTQGSAARKIQPAVKDQTGALPQIKKRKVQRIYIDPVATLGAVVAICMLVMMVVGISQLRIEQQKTAQMVSYVEQLQAKNTALQAQYEEECDLEAVEKTALALGMIPQQSANHTTITVELPQEETSISLWSQIGTFLTGLFA
jgi:hypothetical protein